LKYYKKTNKNIINSSNNTALVEWGTNLTSTVGVKYTRTQLASVLLTPYVCGVIVGLLLSGGLLWFSSSRSKNVRLGLMQSYGHSGYFWFFSILSHYCSSYPVYRERSRYGKTNYSLGIFDSSITLFN
jgi:hypothetical protein